MSKKEKINIVNTLVKKGEIFSALLFCYDNNLSDKHWEQAVRDYGRGSSWAEVHL